MNVVFARTLSIAAFFLLATAPLAAQERAERLEYAVHYGPAMVGDISVQIGCKAETHRPAMLLAQSQGFADQVHSFTVRLDTFVDGAEGFSLEGRTFIEEKGTSRRYRSRFSPHPSVRVEREIRGLTRRQEVSLPERGHDLLSWLLHLRAEPGFGPAMHRAYIVWDGWKLVRLDAVVGRPERVRSGRANGMAHPVTLVRTRLHHEGDRAYRPSAEAERLGTIWLSADARRLPVAMRLRAPIGEVRVTLTGIRTTPC